MTISSVAPAPAGASGPSAGAPGDTGLGALFAGILGVGTTSADPTGSAPPVLPATLGSAHPDDPTEGTGAAEPTDAEMCVVPTDGELPGPVPDSLDIDDGKTDEQLATVRVAGAAELLAAAQMMAAAQVVPVTPVLAAVLGLGTLASTAAGPAGAPATAGPAGSQTVARSGGPQTIAGPAGIPTGSTAVSAGDPVATVPSSAVPLAAPAATGREATAPSDSGTQPAPVGETGPSAAPGAVTAEGSQADTGAGQRHPEPGARGGERVEPVNTPAAPQPTTSAVGAPVRTDAAPAPTGPQQVTGQVFPEVTRLVSRGDGTQRITLKLSPEALGDVRVVLTVRDGDVQVRMVGSELAQQALRAGAPELQRLLDLAGATSSSIVVGDQGSAPDAGLHSGTDRNQDHRTAGTRDGDTSARDGSPGGPQQRPSSDPTATRGGTSTGMAAPSGVDMTM